MKRSRNTEKKKEMGLIERLVTPRTKQRKVKRYMLNKLVIVFGLISLALFGLALYVVLLIRGTHDDYSVEVLSRYGYSSSVIQARRGDIVDRNGNKIATSEPYYILVLDPKVILYGDDYEEKTIESVSRFFELDASEVREAVESNPESSYLRYGGKTLLTYEQVSAFEEYQSLWNAGKYTTTSPEGETIGMTKEEKKTKIKGVWFEVEYRRNYPFSDLASKVIGFTTSDGVNGLWGLETYYNDELTGVNGRKTGYLDEDYDIEQMVYPATDGHTIVSTIDMPAQKIVQENVNAFMEQVGGQNVGVILMNPKNGEILAMATNTEYDLNNPTDMSRLYSEEELAAMSEEERLDALNAMWRNFCISDSYEPGSTSKLITVAAGLEEKVVGLDDNFFCDGYEIRGGWKIHCAHVHGAETFTEAVAYSCNDALMQIVQKEGPALLRRYMTIFNYGQPTGIDLIGEATCEGLIYNEEQLREAELATYSFGQGYNVTMIQQACAVASIVNGGYYYQPRLVKEIRNSEGSVIDVKDPVLVRQTVSQGTSDIMKDIMTEVVEIGTAQHVRIAGYNIGGKTGAAEKLPRGTGDYVVSVISCVEMEDPELMLYVVIDTPQIADQSSSAIALVLAREIWEDLIPYYNVFPDESLLKEGEVVGTTNDSPYEPDEVEIPGYIELLDPNVPDFNSSIGDMNAPAKEEEPEQDNPEQENPEQENPEQENPDLPGDDAPAEEIPPE